MHSLKETPSDLVQSTVATSAERYAVSYHPYTPVIRLNPAAQTLETATDTHAYDRCILALGALPRLLNCQGSGVGHVLSVNHLSEYQRLREQLTPGQSVAIIGAGLVGAELANDLTEGGMQVSLIHDQSIPQTLLPELARLPVILG